MRNSALVFRIGAPSVGFAYGCVVALTFPARSAPLWLVWAPFAVAACTAAGAVFAYGIGRWRELQQLQAVRVDDVVFPVLALTVGSLLLMNVTILFPGPAHLDVRSGLVGTFAIVAAAPAAGAMYGVWRAAVSDSPGKRGELVDLLLALRRLLERLLAAAGTLVALVTFAAGTFWLLERSLHAEYGNRPSQYVLIFGAFGSTLVGLVYVPAWTALQRRGQLLCAELFPLRELDEQAAILNCAGDRRTLEQILGLDRGIFADLQGGLLILAPLIASSASAFLPH